MDEFPQRTTQQNRALHKWCTLIATALNEAGYTQKAVLVEPLDVDWTPYAVKDLMRFIGKRMHGKGHTSEFTTKELLDVQENIIRGLGEKGISIPPFPSKEHEMQA